MAQHDMDVSNQTFTATRADINAALQALISNSSGATAPTPTFAYQWWADTTSGILKQRNAANSAWVSVLNMATGVPLGAAASGTNADITSLTAITALNSGASLPMTFSAGGAARVQIDTSGALTAGLSQSAQYPPSAIAVQETSHATSKRAAMQLGTRWLLLQDSAGNGTRDFQIYDTVAGTTRFGIDTSGNATFTGTVAATNIKNAVQPGSAPTYGARAWCRFDGTLTGTNAPAAGGNVTSVTRVSAGVYDVNLTTAMQDTNYCVSASGRIVGAQSTAFEIRESCTTSTVRVSTFNTNSGAAGDATSVNVAVFR